MGKINYKSWKEKRYNEIYELLKKKDIELLDNKEEFINNDEYKFRCLLCGKEYISSKVRIECCIKEKDYLKEIEEFLDSLDIKVLKNYEIGKINLDFYLPEYKIGIIFKDLFWNCDTFFESNVGYECYKVCKSNNISLIQIFENEWVNKNNVVKSIIKNRLGKNENKIFARNCIIKQISNKEYKEFLNINHIQGFVISKLKLGLYYQDRLVSILSFGQSRFKKGETEIHRFCNLLNTSVIGGFSKLLKYFIKNYNFEKLTTFVDLRYFDGHGYFKNNFREIDRSGNNYFYFKDNLILENRIQYQKHKLKDKLNKFDINLTEIENMKINGYSRIYDCGNLKLQYFI